MRLHGCFGLDGTPRGVVLWSADRPEREVARELLAQVLRGGEVVVCDKGYAGRAFAEAVGELGGQVVRPPRRNERPEGFRPSPIRQRVESIYQTLEDIFCLERHGARTLENLRVRISQRLLALTAGIYVNHWLGRPSRALVDYVA